MSKFCFVLAVYLTFFPYALGGGGCGTELIGDLPNLGSGVSGQLYVVDDSTFCIDDFTYDGQGPDAFLYFYYPGDPIDPTGGGVCVPISPTQMQFQVGQSFMGQTFTITLPEGLQTCDFEGFGIWCRSANQLFTSITWDNEIIFANIECRPSPGGFVGSLPTLEANVGGQLYVRDNKTLVIRDFSYDGQAPDTFIYWYSPGAPVNAAGGGFFIPLLAPQGLEEDEGQFSSIAYEASQQIDFNITIPDNIPVFTCDIGTFTIWCREFTIFFTTIAINGELFSNNRFEVAFSPDLIFCDRPTTQPGRLIGELGRPTIDPLTISGTLYVQDLDTLFIQLFSYDATRENTFFYYYPVGVSPDTTGEAGMRIRFSAESEPLPVGPAESFFNVDFTLDLRLTEVTIGSNTRPLKACDIGYFTILDEEAQEQITMIEIPQAIFTTEEMECCGALPTASTLGICGALAAVLLSFILKA